MEIAIVSDETKEYPNLGTYRYFEIHVGKREVVVTHTPKYVQVLVVNASHRAFRGLGNHFYGGFPEALSHYRSAEVKAAIQCAADLVAQVTKPA